MYSFDIVVCVQVLTKVLTMTCTLLADESAAATHRMAVEAAISCLQALITLVDESAPRTAVSNVGATFGASAQLLELALRSNAGVLVARTSALCMSSLTNLHVRICYPASLRFCYCSAMTADWLLSCQLSCTLCTGCSHEVM
jgi:hypothetical protein